MSRGRGSRHGRSAAQRSAAQRSAAQRRRTRARALVVPSRVHLASGRPHKAAGVGRGVQRRCTGGPLAQLGTCGVGPTYLLLYKSLWGRHRQQQAPLCLGAHHWATHLRAR